jgi:WD40 repeat protein
MIMRIVIQSGLVLLITAWYGQLTAQTYCQSILNEAKEALLKGHLAIAQRKIQDAEICDYTNLLQKERLGIQSEIFDSIVQQREKAVRDKIRADKLAKEAQLALKRANLSDKIAIAAQKDAQESAMNASYVFAQLFEEKAGNAFVKSNYDEAWLYNQEALKQVSGTNRDLPLSLGRLFLQEMIPHQDAASNSLNFDGQNDGLIAPDASRLIANKQISLSLWAFPTRTAFPQWTDFGGLAGFRNENNADFYLIQADSGKVEARFRNSKGDAFTLNYKGLNLNTWNHLVFTYDGTKICLYHDGKMVASKEAQGYITDPGRPLYIGAIPLSPSSYYLFYYKGTLDDVCLWSKCLSQAEVSQLANTCKINLSMAGLESCYEFNQGIPGGDNTSITSAIDSKNNLSASIRNCRLNGSVSNFVEDTRSSRAGVNCTDSHTLAGWKQILAGTKDTILTMAYTPDGAIRLLVAHSQSTSELALLEIKPNSDSLERTEFSANLFQDARTFCNQGKVILFVDEHTMQYVDLGQPDFMKKVSPSVSWRVISTKASLFKGAKTASFSTDGKYLILGFNDGQIQKALISNPNDIIELVSPDNQEVNYLAMSGDGSQLAYVKNKGKLMVKNLNTHTEIRDTITDERETSFLCLAFNPKGDLLATGDNTGQITLWGKDSKAVLKQLAIIPGHIKMVTSLAFSPDGNMLSSCSANQAIRRMNLLINPFSSKQTDAIYLPAFVRHFHEPDQQEKRKSLYDETVKRFAYFKFVSKAH